MLEDIIIPASELCDYLALSEEIYRRREVGLGYKNTLEPGAVGATYSMELDGDEEEVDEDEDMTGMNNGTIDALDDEEEAMAKVEKMQLGAVKDVRSVAGLMKTLEPVLEVSTFPTSLLNREIQRFISAHSPDRFRPLTEYSILPVASS
jgi:hypothetical protein